MAKGSIVSGIKGELCIGDTVVSDGSTDYSYLVGVITAIAKLGTPEHQGTNSTDDVYVNFSCY